MNVAQISPQVFTFTRGYEKFPMTAALILGRDLSVVFDTLLGPADMEPVLEIIRKQAPAKPVVVINSHYHWDHVWGNSAFPGSAIVAHRRCLDRLLADGELTLREYQEKDPKFQAVRLLFPNLTFDESLTLHAGDLTVELMWTPGHTEDSVVAHVPELGLLLAGDMAEYPTPFLYVPGGTGQYIKQLERLASLDLRRVILSHGPVTGPELLTANANYFRRILERVAGAKARGAAREVILAIPFRECLDRWIDPEDSGYEEVHRHNLDRVLRDLEASL